MEFDAKIRTIDLNLYYGPFRALTDVNIEIPAQNVTAIIGPSGCGKSTLLRCFNRMNDLIEHTDIRGQILIDGENILDHQTDLIALRRKVGMVFQRPNVFSLSIYNNLKFGLRIHNLMRKKADIMQTIQESLEHVGLWDDLKDKLHRNAQSLTLEQQQRLCIARVLMLRPDIILLDEPCSTLDPVATLRVEELLRVLRQEYTLVIVTHNMQQAARCSDYTALMYLGRLVEFGVTDRIFTNPREKLTEEYIQGTFG
ncbi:MAG TPA: phosphate ABC transporter ATP-binding protein PstB [Sedimentisphaerales bacterium]|nr:phosphate ABC transporter ATP-binding protein PstB [Sedimentisphaerales bacterium]HRS13019.1 phosphate ABC transporter ATP-binding protein PstB [Sedimentisphaerales bacterium]HRV49634.1 phosphate ABC transporter ATP-binding protein PstB [Sedimentisphaerales bacterium]